MTIGPAHDHPLRSSLTQEMHLRGLPHFAAPARAMQWLVLHPDADSHGAHFRHVAELARLLGRGPIDRTKHLSFTIGELRFIWEEHSEFSTYTLLAQGPFAEPFGDMDLDALPAQWLEAIPGQIFRATKIALLDRATPELSRDLLERLFAPADMVCCDVFDGAARVWTDFRKAGDGFGRLLVHDRGLMGSDAPRLVQQLQELGNYRKMALLGLPLAQRLTKQLATAERELAEISGRIAEQSSDDDEDLLHDISALSATLARLAADTRFRLGATRAYADIVGDRLEGLAVGRLPGSASLRDFNERRLRPAVRTCQSAAARLENLSEQASWTSALMRTRIDTATNRQSRDLLASMNRRTQLQLRLQQTVEGLSVVAISYYLVGLVHYVAEGVGEHRLGGLSVNAATGLAVPFIVMLTAFAMHRVRHSLKGRG